MYFVGPPNLQQGLLEDNTPEDMGTFLNAPCQLEHQDTNEWYLGEKQAVSNCSRIFCFPTWIVTFFLSLFWGMSQTTFIVDIFWRRNVEVVNDDEKKRIEILI